MKRWSWRITSRWTAINFWPWSRNGSIISSANWKRQRRTSDIMNTPVIAINNLTRRYGKLDAVNGLSLTVRPGRCYGFFGRNGAGKTTTIKCLLNLLQPTSGQVRVFGLDPRDHEMAVKSRLVYVPDYVAFYPWMTVRDTLQFLASFRPK